MRGAYFAGAELTNVHLEGANLERATFLDATLCGAFLFGAKLTQAELTNALFQTVATTIPNRNGVGTVTCKAIDLGGAASLDVAVTTNLAHCPNGSNGPCAGSAWEPRPSPNRKSCPPPEDGSFAPNPKKPCAACKDNCECSKLYCFIPQGATVGKCGGCEQ
ncbi:MAG: pentapeptide repeat-containing protein [Labilithrix sp.]|nr:pentapeptide repeat-containing protein [Labilithrix sp.]